MGLNPCPCKFRLDIQGNKATATAVVVNSGGVETRFTDTINFS